MSAFLVFYYIDNELVHEHELGGENLNYILRKFGFDVDETTVVEFDDDDTVLFCWYMKNLEKKKGPVILHVNFMTTSKKNHVNIVMLASICYDASM